MTRPLPRAALVALGAGAALSSAAANADLITASWLNPVSGSWNVGANWSTSPAFPNNGSPSGATYHAVIDAVGGPYTVSIIESSVSLDRLTLNSQNATLFVQGTLALQEDSVVAAGLLRLNIGSLTGAGNLSVFSAMEWGWTRMEGGGTTTIEAGGLLTMNTAFPKTLSRALVIDGEARWTSGALNVTSGGAIVNNGLFLVDATSPILGTLGGSTFNLTNTGTLRTIGGFVEFGAGAQISNSGLLDLQSSTVRILGALDHSGLMTIAAPSTVLLSSSSSLSADSRITGAGVLRIAGGDHELLPGVFAATGGLWITGGSLTLHEAPTAPLTLGGGAVHFNYLVDFGASLVTSSTLHFNAGFSLDPNAAITLGGLVGLDLGAADRQFSTADINGHLAMTGDALIADGLTWRGGSLSGPGATTIAPGGALTLTGAEKTLSRSLHHAGDIAWDGGDLVLDGADFTSAAALVSTGDHSVRSGAGGGQFINDGQVQIESGSLGFLAPLQNNGSVHVAEGATLRLGATVATGASASIAGPGIVDFVGGANTLSPQLLSTTGAVRVSGGVVDIDPAFQPPQWLFTGGAANFIADAPLADALLDGGAIGGAGRLEIDSLHWVRGALASGGDARIAESGAVLIDGPAAGLRTLSRTLVNDGALVIDTGALTIDGGALINNAALSMIGGVSIRGDGAGGAFINNGHVAATGFGTIAIEGAGLNFVNNGTIEFGPGSTLRLGGNIAPGDFGAITGVGSLQFSAGEIFVPAAGWSVVGGLGVVGAHVTFESTPTPTAWTFTSGSATFLAPFNAGPSLSTTGSALRFEGGLVLAPGAIVQATGGGSIDLAGLDAQASRLILQGGSLVGDGDFTATDQFRWTTGSMLGDGRTIIAENAAATIGLFSAVTLGRELINRSEATLGTAFFRLDGGVLHNENFLTTAPSAAVLGIGAGGAIINDGVLRASSAGSFQILNLGGEVEFQNRGLFEIVEGGSALLAGAASATNEGTYALARGSTVDVEGDFVNALGATLRFEVGGYKFNDPAGLLTITGDAALAGALVVSAPKPELAAWGDRWTILQFASLSSGFDTFDLPQTSDETLRWYAQAGSDSYEVGVSHIADIDHDDLIGFSDLNIIASNFNAFGAWADGDVDGDGFVGFADLNIVLSLFNTAAPRSVPAPGAAVVFCLLAASTHRRR